jgi:hypothetical protein
VPSPPSFWVEGLCGHTDCEHTQASKPATHPTLGITHAGADGNATPRFAAYGATKRGLAQLGKSLQVSVGASVGVFLGGGLLLPLDGGSKLQ